MKKKINLIFLSLLAAFLSHGKLYAQELILFLNGQFEYATVVDTTGGIIRVKEYDSGSNKRKNRKKNDQVLMLNRANVFSIKFTDGKEVVYYQQDSISDDDEHLLTVEEMRSYLAGSHDASSRYSSPGSTWISFATGLASGLFLPVVVSPVIPGLMVGLLGSRWIRVDRSHVSNPKYLGDDFYLLGYEKTARARRINGSIGGAVAGLGLGIALSFTVFNQE